MVTRKRLILGGIILLAACLLVAGLGSVWLVRSVPGAARLVFGDPASPTPMPTLRPTFTPMVALPTLTPTPMPTDTAPPMPSATIPPAVTPTDGAPTDAPTLLPSLTPLPDTPTPVSATMTPAPPTATPRPQWIAFETERGERSDYEVFVVAHDGSRLANISHSWADDVAPVWSPNGRRIAFVSFRDTLAGKWSLGPGSIYVVDFDPLTGVDTGEPVRLTDDEGSDGWPTWSPDGSRIAFESDRSGNWDIWIANTDGSGLVNLTRSPDEERYPAWSPDGKRLAFTSRRNGPSNVWALNVEEALQGAGAAGAVNLTKTPHRDRYAMWSPDGRRIAFNTNRDGDQEIYVMNADGSNPTNVSQAPNSIEGLADWSPDGKRLVLYSDRPGNKDLFVVDLATNRWTNITNHPANDEFCTWSP